jgi:uncharacterized protein YqjF (DUF2071 family)
MEDLAPPNRPPRRVPPVIRQQWRDVGFVHWSCDPAALQPLLPRQLRVETHDHAAWVSIVCFSTTCALGGVAPLPGPKRYPETNVRTYVTGPDGTPALYFFSLDVTNRANVLLGRATGLRYRRGGNMQLDTSDQWRYRGVRHGAATVAYDIALQPTDRPATSARDIFLTARWSAFAVVGGHLLRYDVHHEPWPLRQARVASCAETLLAAEGVPDPTSAAIAHVADGVNANLAPRQVVW